MVFHLRLCVVLGLLSCRWPAESGTTDCSTTIADDDDDDDCVSCNRVVLLKSWKEVGCIYLGHRAAATAAAAAATLSELISL